MANDRFRQKGDPLRDTSGGGLKASGATLPAGKAGSSASMLEKTAAWPGLPGGTQKKDRSGGVKKLKVRPSSMGL